MVTTIAVSNQKGGVAKTTTTLSLGACLAELGKTVLLIDFDPQAHLTLSIGMRPEKLRRSVSDVLLASISPVSVSLETGVFALDILPANQELALIDKLLYGQKNYEFCLQQQLKRIDTHFYDIIIIDCPPYFGTLTLNALTAADLLIIPAPCEYYAAHSLRQILALTKLIRRKTNPNLSCQVLVTMYDKRNRICRLVLDQMRQEMNGMLFKTLIEVDAKLPESPAFGQPITVYAPDTRATQQYRALAKELTNYD